ncbi:MAG: hypothetical protein AAF293_19215 [Pseudomonadota bacterium]
MPSAELRGIEARFDSAVDQSAARLSPEAANRLADDIANSLGFTRSQRRKMNPRASRAADAIAEDLRTNPCTLSQVNEAHLWIGQNVAGSADASERALGVEMVRRIDAYLDRLPPACMDGTNNAVALVDDLMTARNATTRRKKAEVLEAPDPGLLARGETRDAIGGGKSGRVLQCLRNIPENPKQRRQFQCRELQAMRDILKG